MDVRRDYRITVALSYFKNKFPCNENGELPLKPGKIFLIFKGKREFLICFDI